MSRRKTIEEKPALVDRAENGACVRTLAAEAGVSFTQVCRWRNAVKTGGVEALRPGALKRALGGPAPPAVACVPVPDPTAERD